MQILNQKLWEWGPDICTLTYPPTPMILIAPEFETADLEGSKKKKIQPFSGSTKNCFHSMCFETRQGVKEHPIITPPPWGPGRIWGQLAVGCHAGSPSHPEPSLIPPPTHRHPPRPAGSRTYTSRFPPPSGLCPGDDKGSPQLTEALPLIRSRCSLMSPRAARPGPGRHLSPRLSRRDVTAQGGGHGRLRPPCPQARMVTIVCGGPPWGGDRSTC